MQEEVGELSHAFLKLEQGIRGTERELRDAMFDAVGDIMIFLASFCNANGIDMDFAVVTAWSEVEKRNWIAFPGNGVDK